MHCAIVLSEKIPSKSSPLNSRDSNWTLTRTRTVLLIDSVTMHICFLLHP